MAATPKQYKEILKMTTKETEKAAREKKLKDKSIKDPKPMKMI